MKRLHNTILLIVILLFSGIQFSLTDPGNPEEPLVNTSNSVSAISTDTNVDTFDETIEMKLYNSGEIETRYYYHSYELSSGFDLSSASQELQNLILWSDMMIEFKPDNNLVLVVVLNTTDQNKAEDLGREAIGLLSDAPDPNFLVAGIDLREGPWNETASVVRLEGTVDVQYYGNLLREAFSHFDQGIPNNYQFPESPPFPTINFGLAVDGEGNYFSRQGFVIRDVVSSLSGGYSFDVADQYGLSSLEPNQPDNNFGIRINVPKDVTSFSISPSTNTTERYVDFTNTTIDFKGSREESRQIQYYFTGSTIDNPQFSFDYQFTPEDLQNSEILLTDLNPYGYINRAFIGRGAANVFSSAIQNQLDTNSSWSDVLRVTFEVTTDLNDTGELGFFNRIAVQVFLQTENQSLADDVIQDFETEFGLNLGFDGLQYEPLFNPYTQTNENTRKYQYSQGGVSITGRQLLMQTDAWSNSEIIPDLTYNTTNYLDYSIRSEVNRHRNYPDTIVPQISMNWFGLETFEDSTLNSPQFAAGTSGNILSVTDLYGLTELNKSSGYKDLVIAFQVPYTSATGDPIYFPTDNGQGFSTFGFADPFFGFTPLTGLSTVPTKTNAYVLHGDAPKVETGQGYVPLTDINVTVPYEILSLDDDVMKPIMGPLAFDADSEFESNYLVNKSVSAVDGTAFGHRMYELSTFNGTEIIYPLIQDHWGVYTQGFNTQTYTDIYGNTHFWGFRYGTSSINSISLGFTYNDFAVDEGAFHQTGTTTANNSLIWTSSVYNYSTSQLQDPGGPSIANFSDPYTWDTTQFADGVWSLNVTATDAAGNVGSRTIQVTVDNYETVGNPSVSVNSDSDIKDNSYLTSDGKLVVDAIQDIAPIFDVGLTFQGQSAVMQYNATDGTYYWDLPFDEILTGPHTVTITVVDFSGGKSSLSIKFNVDKQTHPVIDNVYPTDNEVFDLKKTIPFWVIAHDPDGTTISAEVSFDNDSPSNMTKGNSTYFFYDVNSTVLGLGDHTVSITIFDNDIFNKSTSISFNISVADLDASDSSSSTTNSTSSSVTNDTSSSTSSTPPSSTQETTSETSASLLGGPWQMLLIATFVTMVAMTRIINRGSRSR